MIFVLDASAMIAYLRAEPGGDQIRAALSNRDDQFCAHAANLCEVYYDFYRSGGEAAANEAINDLLEARVTCFDELSIPFWKAAGALKARQRRVSLADCFALTLASRLGATLLTADHHEFDALVSDSAEYRISFIQ